MNEYSRTHTKTIIAFVILLDLMDTYTLSHEIDVYTLHVKINKYETTINSSCLNDLLKLLGEWLVKLPKSIWKNKELNKTRYENTIQRQTKNINNCICED